MNNVLHSPQTCSSIFIWGLIGAGILASIEIIWYILMYFWLGDFIYALISHLPNSPSFSHINHNCYSPSRR